MVERCLNCGLEVPRKEGIRTIGRFGKWKGRRLVFCNTQCIIEWDCEGVSSVFKGNQAVNLEEVLMGGNKNFMNEVIESLPEFLK